MSENRWAQAVKEHEKIIEKIAARDVKGLSDVLAEHMRNKQASVLH